jgi:hypothetical protein
VPERRPVEEGTEIVISPIPPRDAVFGLMRRSFRGYIVETKELGLRSHRFNMFVDLAQKAPMRRMVHPPGLEYLPRVREAILEDLSKQR